jgi:hypothetical protein
LSESADKEINDDADGLPEDVRVRMRQLTEELRKAEAALNAAREIERLLVKSIRELKRGTS